MSARIYIENRDGRIYWGTHPQYLMEMEVDPSHNGYQSFTAPQGRVDVELVRAGSGEVYWSTDRSTATSLASPVTLHVDRDATLVWFAPRSEGTWHGGYVSTSGGQDRAGPST